MSRRLLAAMSVLVLSVAAGACTSAGGADAGAHANDGPPRVTLEGDIAKEALGEDDGFAGVIFYGAELQGSIDDCGCPGHPMGGSRGASDTRRASAPPIPRSRTSRSTPGIRWATLSTTPAS